ncbi:MULTISPECIES: VRR-NUC domain-containing protein [Erysipelotrichaceae]|uniref:VRR-NUC domain-containing protein n=1 Tax=[Eubacterium] hominis TaxID=2764325 RepID=A0A7G9GNP3_9FIRM|nr:VRR-NUC domain-containing protein [Absiella sp. AM27-20]QNM12425.1 VRR-NUC domain-containing protein [[Eubacterium] hominis]RHU10671.1 VRR-NUC domain-containing protein [Absiella sp. AM27-20]
MSNGVVEGFNPAKKPKKREFKIEDYLKEQVEKIGGKCYKFVSPGYDGMPDRIVVFSGCVIFVETKRPGKKPRALQKIRLEELQMQGVITAVVSTKKEADFIVDFLSTRYWRT